MKNIKIPPYILALAGSLVLVDCTKNASYESTRSINGSSYEMSANTIVQRSGSYLEDKVIRIGLVSDIEGAIDSAKSSAIKLKEQNIDFIVIAGDTYENEQIRRMPLYATSTDNVSELVEGIRPYAELNVPVFIIPGNHEERRIYNQALKNLSKDHKNVFDLNAKNADLIGINVVGMGGYHDSRFMPQNGFKLDDQAYTRAEKSLLSFQEQNEPIIFLTHGPPQAKKSGIDYVSGFGHVGDNRIAQILNKSNLHQIINIHGHIHEGGKQMESYPAGTALNIASITRFQNTEAPRTMILQIQEGKVNLQELK